MGYTTEFRGAFRVTPQVEPAVAIRLNFWLNCRHWKRPIPNQTDNLLDLTLFGSPGKNGQYVMPSIIEAIKKAKYDPTLAPRGLWEDEKNETFIAFQKECGWRNFGDLYNYEPKGIPSLWSDINVIPDPIQKCSWLMWNQSDKAYEMDFWFSLITQILVKLGYQVEGHILAQGEDMADKWGLEADGTRCSQRIDNPKFAETWHNESLLAMDTSEDLAEKLLNFDRDGLIADIMKIKALPAQEG